MTRSCNIMNQQYAVMYVSTVHRRRHLYKSSPRPSSAGPLPLTLRFIRECTALIEILSIYQLRDRLSSSRIWSSERDSVVASEA